SFENIDCLLVDEAQFLSKGVIDQFRQISLEKGIPIICYGLRTDFRTHLFEGSKRLMELADSIEEVKSTCHYCNRKAVMNLKHVNGRPKRTGASIQLGCEETYFPTCCSCYFAQFRKESEKNEEKELALVE
ncbi:MAG: thymidine kinase, partial [Chlamydiales bacterium]